MGDPIVNIDPDYGEICQRCDTRLMTADGTVFHVNSELLSRHSKFFNSLFLMGEETGQSTVIRDIKPDVFHIILTYMSTGEVLLTTENIMDLLVASDFLMIESLLDKCRKFVLQDKKVDNLVSYFITANRIKGLDLEDHCRRFLVLCFEKAVMHSMEEACRLPYGDLKYFLSHRSLNVSDEHVIWSVIEAYVQTEPLINQLIVPELLRCLSIHEIGDKLASTILSSPVIRNNMVYRDVGDPRVTFDFLSNIMKAQSVILFRNKLPVITEVRLPRFLHVVAKLLLDRQDAAELYISYDDSLDLWRKVGDISLTRAPILVSGHMVYYLTRVRDGHYELSGFYFDLLRNEQRPMKLPYRRNYEAYVVGEVGGCIYALEIFGSLIQRYVHETDEWKNVRRVRYRGCNVGALNVNGLLHVLGEVDGSNRMFMRVYDPSKDEWRRVPSPSVRRFYAESAVFQGKIFLVAGQVDVNREESDGEDDYEACDEELDEDYEEECSEYDEEDDDEDDDYGGDFASLAPSLLELGNAINNAIDSMEEDEVDPDEEDEDDPDEEDDEWEDVPDEDDDDHPEVLLNVILHNMRQNRNDYLDDNDDEEGDPDDDEEVDADDDEEDDPDDDDVDHADVVIAIDDDSDSDESEPDPDGDNAAVDRLFAALDNAFHNNGNIMEEAMNNIEQDESISKAVEVYDPKSKEWMIYPELPFRYSPVFVSVVKDRLFVYQNPQRPVSYWDGSGQWKIVEDSSRLFHHKFSVVKDEEVVRQIMKKNKEEEPTVWLETGLEKVIP